MVASNELVPLNGVVNRRLSMSSTPETYILQSSALLTVDMRSITTVASVFSATSRPTVS